MEWFAVAGSALALGLVTSSCTDDAAQPPLPAPACANVAPEKSSPACTPLYEPNFDNVFANTLKPTCAKSGVSCHASTGRQGGLAFEDADESYRQLLETTQVARPGSPSCSPLVGRIAAVDGNVRMPPGRSLDANEQCSIVQWIANGAKR
jgi:hypothetical protein